MGSPVTLPPGFELDDLPSGFEVDKPAQMEPPTIKPAPEAHGIGEHIARWTDNVAHDLKYGTDLTGIGSVLKKMGAHGLNVGNSEKVGEFMGSMPLGLLQFVKGNAEIPDHPLQGAKDVVAGAFKAGEMPSMLAGPETEAATYAVKSAEKGVQAVSKGAKAAIELIPSAGRAGERFSSVMQAAHDLPIDINTPGDIALRTQKLAESGGSMPKVVRDFLKRVTDPNKGPLTYQEGRDFYSNATRISADEAQRLTPVMRRQVGEFTASLNSSLEQAAEHVGKLSDYQKAMGEYHQAMRLRALKEGAADVLKSGAAKTVAGAGAGAAGAYAVRELLK